MTHQIFIFLLVLNLITGCSQFRTGRSYTSEMEHDDSRFFSPNEDFPIVSGDSGRYWMTDKERKLRTPMSEEESFKNRTQDSLKAELHRLEKNQPDEDFEFYQLHKHRFQTISENIYFLKLPYYERKSYLIDRGFIQPTRAPSSVSSIHSIKNDVVIGMNKGQVMASMGRPSKVEVAGNPRDENERWLYHMNGASKYIYFESGEVQGWE